MAFRPNQNRRGQVFYDEEKSEWFVCKIWKDKQYQAYPDTKCKAFINWLIDDLNLPYPTIKMTQLDKERLSGGEWVWERNNKKKDRPVLPYLKQLEYAVYFKELNKYLNSNK